MMPGIGGIELADRLRERWPELPIVFMSGYSAEVLADEGSMGVGAELIQKPFTPAGLVQRVSDVLRRTGAAITPSG
jgi:DNA-binding response OmpR family regulator